jgi:hypothetical protein
LVRLATHSSLPQLYGLQDPALEFVSVVFVVVVEGDDDFAAAAARPFLWALGDLETEDVGAGGGNVAAVKIPASMAVSVSRLWAVRGKELLQPRVAGRSRGLIADVES